MMVERYDIMILHSPGFSAPLFWKSYRGPSQRGPQQELQRYEHAVWTSQFCLDKMSAWQRSLMVVRLLLLWPPPPRTPMTAPEQSCGQVMRERNLGVTVDLVHLGPKAASLCGQSGS